MDLEKQAELIVNALAHTESNGKPKAAKGLTGELHSFLQFLPSTWEGFSKEYTGGKVLPVTPENEYNVAKFKVKQWLSQGNTPTQIASIWNSNDPDAYKGKFTTGARKGAPAVGLSSKNKNVKFDVPAYANKFNKFYNQLSKEKNIQSFAQNTLNNKDAVSMSSTTPAVSQPLIKGKLPELASSKNTVKSPSDDTFGGWLKNLFGSEETVTSDNSVSQNTIPTEHKAVLASMFRGIGSNQTEQQPETPQNQQQTGKPLVQM